MAENKLYPKPELIPLKRVTPDAFKLLRIGEDFIDLGHLGLIGEFTIVEATDICPRLYYRWNYYQGIWEIYTTEHDLLGYTVGAASDLQLDVDTINGSIENLDERVTALEGTTPVPPTIEPTTEEPTTPPTEPDYHSIISRDPDKIGGADLVTIRDGGIFIFSGNIKWYKAGLKFPTDGNYVGITITPSTYLWNYYKNTLRIKYKGMTFDQSVFVNGKFTLYVYVVVPGQEVPIRFYWSDGVEEDFTVCITQESHFYNADGSLRPTDDEEDETTTTTESTE